MTNSQIKQGPASIESAVDEVLAAPGVVDSAIKAEEDGVQAVVIDCMLDPGLDAARAGNRACDIADALARPLERAGIERAARAG